MYAGVAILCFFCNIPIILLKYNTTFFVHHFWGASFLSLISRELVLHAIVLLVMG